MHGKSKAGEGDGSHKPDARPLECIPPMFAEASVGGTSARSPFRMHVPGFRPAGAAGGRTERLKALRDIQQRLGNTPLCPVVLTIDGVERTVWLKFEGKNPAGSIKARTAFSLVADLEARERLHTGSLLVESTSGNLGVALAWICEALGLTFVAVVDPKIPPGLVDRMRHLGARVDMVDQPDTHGNHLAARLAYVDELCRRDARCVWVDQYSSPANPHVHYRDTGREIWEQLADVEAVFVAVGTGGTLAGVARFFREANPATRVIGVDVPGSLVFGGVRAPRHLSGIGSARPSDFLNPSDSYQHSIVSEALAVAMCRRLACETGIRLGGSGGAALAACAQYLRAHPEAEHAVCLCPDGGESYTSTVYCDTWLHAAGIDPRCGNELQWLTSLRSLADQAPRSSAATSSRSD